MNNLPEVTMEPEERERLRDFFINYYPFLKPKPETEADRYRRLQEEKTRGFLHELNKKP